MPLEFELREHRTYEGYNPDIRFPKVTGSEVSIDSSLGGTGSMGNGYVFRNLPRTWLHGKRVRVRWLVVVGEASQVAVFEVVDGHYDRESMTDFPDEAFRIWKGSGQLKFIAGRNYPTAWEVVTSGVLDLSAGTEDECCLFVYLRDPRNDYTALVRLDYIEILDADLNSLAIEQFDDTAHMEVTGTYNDYGWISYGAPYHIIGVTRDSKRQPLGNCVVWLFRTVDKTFLEETTSDENGNYEFKYMDGVTEHFVTSHKDGVPNVFGRTDRNLKGVLI